MASFGDGDDNTAINLVYVSTMHFDYFNLNGATEVRKCEAKSGEQDIASKKEGVRMKGWRTSRNPFAVLSPDAEEEEDWEEEEEEEEEEEREEEEREEEEDSSDESNDESNSRSSDSGTDNTTDSKKRQWQTEKKKKKRKRKKKQDP